MCRFYLVLSVICYFLSLISYPLSIRFYNYYRYFALAICYLWSVIFYLLPFMCYFYLLSFVNYILSVIFFLLSFILDFQNLGISQFNFDDKKNCQPETSTGAIWVNCQKHLSLWLYWTQTNKQTNRQPTLLFFNSYVFATKRHRLYIFQTMNSVDQNI